VCHPSYGVMLTFAASHAVTSASGSVICGRRRSRSAVSGGITSTVRRVLVVVWRISPSDTKRSITSTPPTSRTAQGEHLPASKPSVGKERQDADVAQSGHLGPLAGAAEGGGTRRTGDDPSTPRHRPNLNRPDPEGTERRFVSPRACSRSSAREASRTNSRSQGSTCCSRSSTALPSTRQQSSASRSSARWTSRRQTLHADYVAELPVDQFPKLVAVSEHCGHADNDQSFELLIDLFVDGLAQRVHARDQKPARGTKHAR
jgi:hypothetical protein